MNKVRQLTVQGGNGALGDTSRTALAEEIKGLKENLLAQANTTYLGRPVFAGTVESPAFEADYSFNGTGAAVNRTVATGTSIRVDSVGSKVFGEGDESVFRLLDDIVGVLETGNDPVDRLADIDVHVQNMLKELSSNGARQNQIDSAQDLIADNQITATSRLGSIQDVDLAQIILDLQSQEVAYQGALGAAAKVLQPTLLDFLR
jgi:flagellar hook-associated protein 3 FlgL